MTGMVTSAVRSAFAPVWTTLRAEDELRRFQGRMLDLVGLGPQQLPSRVLLATPAFRVRSYAPVSNPAPPLLLVAAPIKRAYIWDLVPQASTVRLLTEAGFAVHLLEWLDRKAYDEDLGLEAYANLFIGDAVEAVRHDSGDAPLLVGHSLGGTLAAIFCARHPEQVAGAVLLEAPLHFGADAGAFAPVVAASPDTRLLQPGLRAVPGSFLDLVTVTAAPREFLLDRHVDLIRSLGRPALQVNLRVQRWTLDEFAVPGRLFAEVVEDLYREDRFMRSDLTIGGRRVGASSLVVPMLNVVNPHSGLIPPSSVVPFHRASASRAKELLWYHGDQGVSLQHVGVLVGRSAHTCLWPRIVAWIRGLHQPGRAEGAPADRA
jgi:polyhydroxyalkanoate synthase